MTGDLYDSSAYNISGYPLQVKTGQKGGGIVASGHPK